VIDFCTISHNNPNSTGRRDGGGIGLEVSISDRTSRSLRTEDLLDSLIPYLRD
jgi:hypothetical protein